jgi:polyhydroxybutyrate depolymerase
MESKPARRSNVGHVEMRHVVQGSIVRDYRLYRPTTVSRRPGVVILLHGATGSGEEMARLTGFDRQSDRIGWIAAYLDAHNPGPNGGWDAHACCAQPGVDDLAFVRRVIDIITTEEAVDPARVSIAGFSRGGMMAYRLGCELADRVSAIAVVAGNMADRFGSVAGVRCWPSRPVSVLVVHGTGDRNVPAEGGPGPDELRYFSERPDLGVGVEDVIHYAPLEQVLRHWRQVNNCSVVEALVDAPPVTTRRWDGPAGVCVESWLIAGGTHTWPGPSHPSGSADASLDASRIIADFFLNHPRAASSGGPI